MEENRDLQMNNNLKSLDNQEESLVGQSDILHIKDEDVWSYHIEGLSAPRINKPVKNRLFKQIVFVIIIIVAVGLAIYFSVAAVQKDTFEFKVQEDGVQLYKFNNTGYITELYIDYYTEIEYYVGNSDPYTNFYFVKDENKPVSSIREYAFNCDEKLEVVYIGENVKEIDGKSFYSCSMLTRIVVDDNNPYYCDIDGVLYNKDVTEIICYPINHSQYLATSKGVAVDSGNYNKEVLTYKLPATVTKIGKLAFNYTDLKVVYLPEGLKSLETMSFFRASSLDYIYSYNGDLLYNSLPEGIEYIGSDAFSYCQELDYMYIPSSVKEIGHHAFWDSVYKENGELKGLKSINVAVSKEEFKKEVSCGDQWRPKYDFLLFKKNVDINYNAIRNGV